MALHPRLTSCLKNRHAQPDSYSIHACPFSRSPTNAVTRVCPRSRAHSSNTLAIPPLTGVNNSWRRSLHQCKKNATDSMQSLPLIQSKLSCLKDHEYDHHDHRQVAKKSNSKSHSTGTLVGLANVLRVDQPVQNSRHNMNPRQDVRMILARQLAVRAPDLIS